MHFNNGDSLFKSSGQEVVAAPADATCTAITSHHEDGV